MQLPPKKFREYARSALAGLLALLIVWTVVVAANPAHHDRHLATGAHGPHVCVACLFAHGQVIAPEASPVRAAPDVLVLAGYAIEPTSHPGPREFQLPPGRAPPPVFS